MSPSGVPTRTRYKKKWRRGRKDGKHIESTILIILINSRKILRIYSFFISPFQIDNYINFDIKLNVIFIGHSIFSTLFGSRKLLSNKRKECYLWRQFSKNNAIFSMKNYLWWSPEEHIQVCTVPSSIFHLSWVLNFQRRA